MDLIEDIGPILGLVAFLGFAILALLIVLQAREVRRLREWAGRAPERAAEADDADKAAAEARGEEPEAEEPGRLGRFRERVAAAVRPRWDDLDRRSPVDPRWFLGILAAGLIALVVVTSGFGLFGGDEEPSGGQTAGGGKGGAQKQEQEDKVTVAVLNATQIDDPVAPVDAVSGIADVVAEEIVQPAGFKVVARTNAPAGEEKTLIMFEPDSEAAAAELASSVEQDLGPTDPIPITDEVAAVAKDAQLVLLVGLDDAEFGPSA